MPTVNQDLDNQSVSILYGASLYHIETINKKESSKTDSQKLPTEPSIPKPKVIVIVRDQLSPKTDIYEMFTKLLDACKLSIEHIHLISPYTFELTSSVLLKEYTPSHIIMFGVGSSEIGLSVYFPDFQVQQVEGVTYLTSPDLNLVAKDKNIKLALWKSLQKALSL